MNPSSSNNKRPYSSKETRESNPFLYYTNLLAQSEFRKKKLPANICFQIITSYLIRHGYKQTVEALIKSHCDGFSDKDVTSILKLNIPMIPPHLDKERNLRTCCNGNLQSRKRIISFIRSAKIEEAILECATFVENTGRRNRSFHRLFPNLYLQLRLQQFLELIRSKEVMLALDLAKEIIRPLEKSLTGKNEEINEYIQLIMYKDPEQSPYANLMSNDYLEELASFANDQLCMYAYRCSSGELEYPNLLCPLERSMLQLSLLRLKLADEKMLPPWHLWHAFAIGNKDEASERSINDVYDGPNENDVGMTTEDEENSEWEDGNTSQRAPNYDNAQGTVSNVNEGNTILIQQTLNLNSHHSDVEYMNDVNTESDNIENIEENNEGTTNGYDVSDGYASGHEDEIGASEGNTSDSSEQILADTETETDTETDLSA